MKLRDLFIELLTNYRKEVQKDSRTNSPYAKELKTKIHEALDPIAGRFNCTIKALGGQGALRTNPYVTFLAKGHKTSKGIYPALFFNCDEQTVELVIGDANQNPPPEELATAFAARAKAQLPLFSTDKDGYPQKHYTAAQLDDSEVQTDLNLLLSAFSDCCQLFTKEIAKYLESDSDSDDENSLEDNVPLVRSTPASTEQLQSLIEEFMKWYQNDKHSALESVPEYQQFSKAFFEKISDNDLAEVMFRFAHDGGKIQSGGERTAGRLKDAIQGNTQTFRENILTLFEPEFNLSTWWAQMDAFNHFGMGVRSIFIHRIFPDRYAVVNKKSIQGLHMLGLLPRRLPKDAARVEAITEAAEKIVRANPENINLYRADAMMHFLVAIKEGQAAYREIMGVSAAEDTRYWTIACGRDGEFEDDFLDNGIIAIGWDELNKISRFRSKKELAIALKSVYPKLGSSKDTESDQRNNVLACHQFAFEIKIGDIVFLKKGQQSLLGYGRVTSDYVFDDSRARYQHIRKIAWIQTGERTVPDSQLFALKTLTDITKYDNFAQELMALYSGSPKNGSGSRNYWWLNANPSIWSFTSFGKGKVQSYTTHNDKGNKRRVYSHFQSAKTDDIIIGYQSSPDRQIVALCAVTKPVSLIEGKEALEFRIEEILETPIDLAALQGIPDLANAEPIINNQGSLFKLTAAEYETIRAIIDEKGAGAPSPIVKPFTKQDALRELFMSEEQLDSILYNLKHKKNIVLQGPPGVGKTFAARLIAATLMGKDDRSRIETIQFHQSYSYEDFIQGYRPTAQGSFNLKNGPFFEFCRRAMRDPSSPYVFIIDEINRGNLSKIFGELMMLIEHDKRGPKHAISLMYSTSREETFYVPENVYLIGAMNTADRSLAMVDYALRRRFSFIDLKPEFDSSAFTRYLTDHSVPEALTKKIVTRLNTLNDLIQDDSKDLGSGYRIGHSFFCPNGEKLSYDESWYRQVVVHEVLPLLREYWFDKEAKIDEARDLLLS